MASSGSAFAACTHRTPDKMTTLVEELIDGLYEVSRGRGALTKPDGAGRPVNPQTLNELTLTLFQPQNNTAMTLPQAKYSQLGGTPTVVPGAIKATRLRALNEFSLTLLQPYNDTMMTLWQTQHPSPNHWKIPQARSRLGYRAIRPLDFNRHAMNSI